MKFKDFAMGADNADNAEEYCRALEAQECAQERKCAVRYLQLVLGHEVEQRRIKEMPQLALTEAVFYILLSLQKPLHGYGIIQNVGELSNGRVKLAAGTLYGALNSLVEKGWIDALPENPESRKKEYVITKNGQAVLKEELDRLSELVDNGKRILGGN